MLDQPRKSQRYEGKPKSEDERLTRRILELGRQRPRWGYRRIGALLRVEGELVNFKRVYRLWQAAGLKVPHKRRKYRVQGQRVNACDVQPATRLNDVWTWDFMQQSMLNGRTVRLLSVVDEYSRRCLIIKASHGIKSEDAIDTLAELFSTYGAPRRLRCDNGPEFISEAVKDCLAKVSVELLQIQP